MSAPSQPLYTPQGILQTQTQAKAKTQHVHMMVQVDGADQLSFYYSPGWSKVTWNHLTG